jgi:hypothetical protein
MCLWLVPRVGEKIPREPNLWPPPPRLTHLPAPRRIVIPLFYQDRDAPEQDKLAIFTSCFSCDLLELPVRFCGYAV